MLTIPNAPAWLGIGWLIALVVLVVDIVLLVLAGIDLKLGLLIGGLAVARLL